METIAEFTPLFVAGIFFIGFLALLLTGFNSLLDAKITPLKENQVRFEKRLDKLEAGQAQLSADIAEIKQLLSALKPA